MKHVRSMRLVALCWLLCAAFWTLVSVLDRVSPPSTLAGSQAPSLTGYVNDETGMLSKGEADTLNDKLSRFNVETSIQAMIAIVAPPQDSDIERFSIQVAEKARIGQADRDNGVILFVFPSAGIARLEIGYGLEGVLPDVLAHRVLVDDMAPSWRAGKHADALASTLDGMMALIRNEYAARGSPSRSAVLLRKISVGTARVARHAWPMLRAVDLWHRVMSSFFAGLVLFCLWDGIRQTRNLVQNVVRSMGVSKHASAMRKETVRVDLGAIRDSLVLLLIGVGGIIAAAGAVILAEGGAFGGAGATLHF